MLQFVFGLPRSGKTQTLLEKVSFLSQHNCQSIIIVPEQASFETEKKVLSMLGDSFSLNVKVLSFSRLYDEICREVGGSSGKVLKNSDKVLFMNKALKQAADKLCVWGKYVNSLNFAQTMLDTVGEFKINAITPDEIKAIIPFVEKQGLKNKLNDLYYIFESYNTLIAERYIDPADLLTKLYYKLENYNFFKNKTVFFDGFKGFTGQQYKVIDRILSQSEKTYFALTYDTCDKNEFSLYSNIRTAISRIEKIAHSHNIKIEKPIILNDYFYKNDGLINIERLLSDKPLRDLAFDQSINICKCKNIYDETEYVASTIRRLVRTKNYRYRDFLIVARDSEKYARAIDYACQKNHIDCFIDKSFPMLSFPISVAVLSAIKAVDFSTENILRFLKSGVNYLTVDEISTLENYTYLWNITGALWCEEWTMDPRGFVTNEPTADSVCELKKINNLRQKAITPILNFKNALKGNAREMSLAVLNLLDESAFTHALKQMCNNYSKENVYTSDALKQCYDTFMQILDSVVNCYGNATINITEFYEALKLALSMEEISVIPQTIDQVVFGQADHIRPSSPKIVFIMGANQGVFPHFGESCGVFATSERKILLEAGMEIADNEIFATIDENFLVYTNLCCAEEFLYITYSAQTIKGEELTPSSFIISIKENLNVTEKEFPLHEFSFDSAPETVEAAFSEFCRAYNKTPYYAVIEKALDNPTLTSRVTGLNTKNNEYITRQNAQALYGENINLSATKFDTFHRCKFSFFCKYGLRIKKIQPADFDVLQRGTIVHYVLESIISTYKGEIKAFSAEKLNSLCDFYINQYLDSVKGYRRVQNARHSFLILKISRLIKEVVNHLAKEFAQSDFEPMHCEFKIGGKDGLPISFDYENGKIFLNGSIDRIDGFNSYIRIIDYKTGTKSFKLPDVLFGLNLQMLIYLYAVIRGQGLADGFAGGIFYMPSKRDLNNEGLAMNGLVKSDIDLVRAMEKENNGEFVPALSINKDGTISKTATSFVSEQEFTKIFDHIEKLMYKTGTSIANGEISINPMNGRESSACDYCDFKAICAIENREVPRVPNLKNFEVFAKMNEEDNNGI